MGAAPIVVAWNCAVAQPPLDVPVATPRSPVRGLIPAPRRAGITGRSPGQPTGLRVVPG